MQSQEAIYFLYSSKYIAAFPIKDKWIFFLPDSFGMPIVVSSLVKHIFDAFSGGAFVNQVTDYINKLMNVRKKEILRCINYLYTNKYIRQVPNQYRYASRGNIPVQAGESVEVWLHITNHCNLGCEYCFVQKSNISMSDKVMDNTIDNLVSAAKERKLKCMTIKFAGGEPIVAYKKIIYFYNSIKERFKNLETTLRGAILTNGTVLNDEIVEFIKKNKFGISISLDGYGEEGHDIYRLFKNTNKGSWNIVSSNINKLIQNGIKPYILATLSEDSVNTLTELVSWIFKNNLSVRLGVVREPKLLRKDDSHDAKILYHQYCEKMNLAFEKMFLELEKPDYPVDIIRKINICELHFEQPTTATCCGIGRNHIVIREDGLLSNCPMTLKEIAVPQEKDILVSVQRTFLHSPLERGKSKDKSCLDCQWFPVCVGGCPINNKRNTGNPFSISPLHHFYQYVIPRFVNFYGNKIYQYAKLNRLTDYHFLEY